MYFDFEDYHPDITPVGRAISWREGVLLSIIVHLALIIFVLVAPRFLPQRPRVIQAPRVPDHTQFVFVQPRNDIAALRPPDRGEGVRQGSRGARAGARAGSEESAAVRARQLA